MQRRIKKVALIGPESSGKTTLCRKLAEHFHTVWVPEYAREYIGSLDRKYTIEDIEHCAKEQIAAEDWLLGSANGILFCDSDMIIAKVWCEDVFKMVPEWIEDLIRTHAYDLFLLTAPDIPFQQDTVRENPHRREFFFKWYKRELEERKFSFEIISGENEIRLERAIRAVERVM